MTERGVSTCCQYRAPDNLLLPLVSCIYLSDRSLPRHPGFHCSTNKVCDISAALSGHHCTPTLGCLQTARTGQEPFFNAALHSPRGSQRNGATTRKSAAIEVKDTLKTRRSHSCFSLFSVFCFVFF